jgi:uncharacterized protein
LPEFEVFDVPLRIGLVSDTHLVNPKRGLPSGLLDGLQGCDLILHAGDIQRTWVLDALREVGPVRAVFGNNDAELIGVLPFTLFFQIGSHRIGLIHGWDPQGGGRVTAKVLAQREMHGLVDCVVYGHSHIPEVIERDGLLMVNPGSTMSRPWTPPPGYAIMEVNDSINVERVTL